MKVFHLITIIIITFFPFIAYFIYFDSFSDSFAFKIIFNQLRPNRFFLVQHTEDSFYLTTFFSYIFSILGIIGLLFKKEFLQKLFYAITLNISISFLLGSIFALLFGENDDIFLNLPPPYRLLVIVFHLVWICLSFIGIKKLQNLDEENLDKNSVASKSKRLINFTIDSLTVFISTIVIAQIGLAKLLQGHSDNYIILFFSLYSIIYYPIFEYFFCSTIGKFTTGTKLVSLNNQTTLLKQVLIRTYVRLIPIEPFSFLFSETGWHDKLSDTTIK